MAKAEPEQGREQPYDSIAARIARGVGADVDPKIELADASAAPSTTSGSGKVIERLAARGPMSGRYQVLGEVARGGMGAILEVLDVDLRRKLAMKVVLQRDGRAGGASAGVDPTKLSRFLEEAQVTGQLDHPGIVPVHELGLDPNGQVYFTMRLVAGRTLDAIFKLVPDEREGWTTTRAAGLLLKVCEAMAYAHKKGVVHRDLKPANVMVGEFGEVYVMDWGLARVLGRVESAHEHGERTPHALVATDRRDDSGAPASSHLNTLDGDVIGTPAYMSPEQARGRLSEITEASDVYAVGAMLYRLLAGIEPYYYGGAHNASVVLERLWQGPPRRVEELAPHAPVELVAICEKAMAREPRERYADMLALADDLRAYLEGRVVGAYETGALAEARKWMRRNKALASALAAGLVVLIAGLATSVVLGRRAENNAVLAEKRRVQADESSLAAQRQARVAEEVNTFLNDDLFGAIAPERAGRDVTVREVLDNAAQNMHGRFADEPGVEAQLRTTIGTSFARLGFYDDAREHLVRAVELGRKGDGVTLDQQFNARLELAGVELRSANFASSIELLEEVVADARELLGDDHEATLTALNDLALALQGVERNEEALALFRELLPLQERVLGENDADTLVTLNNLTLLEQRLGDVRKAVAVFEDVLARERATQGERSPATVATLNNLGTALADAGRMAEGEERAREAVALALELHGDDHPITANARGNLGTIVLRRGRREEALTIFSDALAATRARFADEHPQVLLLRANLATAMLEVGRAQEALDLGERVLEARRRVLGETHLQTLQSLNEVAGSLRALGRLDEAAVVYRELIDAQRGLGRDDHPLTLVALENLGNVLYAQKQHVESIELLHGVLEARQRVLGPEHPDVTKTQFNLGIVIAEQGDARGAREQFEGVLARVRASDDAAPELLENTLRNLGNACMKLPDHAAALAAYREALELVRAREPDSDSAAYLLHQISAALSYTGAGAEALERIDEALRLRENLLGPDDSATQVSRAMHLHVLMQLERFAEAETAALELHESLERTVGADDGFTRKVRGRLADIYTALGRADEAGKWR